MLFNDPLYMAYLQAKEAVEMRAHRILRHAEVEALDIILGDINYTCNLPKWMAMTENSHPYPFMAVRVLGLAYYYNHHIYYGPDNFELPLRFGEDFDLSKQQTKFDCFIDVLNWVSEHRNGEEEIHLAPDWCLLRYEGRRHDSDQWESDEVLLEATLKEMVGILHNIKILSLNFDHYRKIRIFDGSKWHSVRTLGGIHFTIPYEEISRDSIYVYLLAN